VLGNDWGRHEHRLVVWDAFVLMLYHFSFETVCDRAPNVEGPFGVVVRERAVLHPVVLQDVVVVLLGRVTDQTL
jgi:hypothetical protein